MADPARRRNFLRGRLTKRRVALRPPWAVAEGGFVIACTRCGDCRTACPTGIIGHGDGGFPALDFSLGECTFCAACASVCMTGAVQRAQGRAPWRLRATIGERCLARQQIECRICGDLCGADAIRFLPQPGGISLAVVGAAQCTGCGACVASCPTAAIALGQSPDAC
jgi:ferredoxin-type protein NapF